MELLTLNLLSQTFAIARLEQDDPIPAWALGGTFASLTYTRDELSIVCEQQLLPPGLKAERDRRALMVQGPLDFSLTGILSALSGTLAQAGISIFAISTYDTDYILVQEEDLDHAIAALREAGCTLQIAVD